MDQPDKDKTIANDVRKHYGWYSMKCTLMDSLVGGRNFAVRKTKDSKVVTFIVDTECTKDEFVRLYDTGSFISIR